MDASLSAQRLLSLSALNIASLFAVGVVAVRLGTTNKVAACPAALIAMAISQATDIFSIVGPSPFR